MNMPVEDYLKSFISNQSLVDVISQHFFKNTPTFFALSYFSLYLDYFYPIGGVGKLANVLEEKIIELKGDIRAETRVTEVDASKQIVTDEKGSSYAYNNLVWAADLKTLYTSLITDGLSDKVIRKFTAHKSELLECRGGDSIFSLYLEVDEPLETLQKIAHGHFFYTPVKDGLGETHWSELTHILDHWEEISKAELLLWLDKYTRLNTYEISVPGLKDPSLVPPGKTGMIVSFLAEYDLFAKIEQDGWYKEFKTELENRMIDVLTHSIYPFLKEKVIKQFSFSPVSIKNRIGSSEGAITGWSFEKSIPVVHRVQFSDRSTLTPLPGMTFSMPAE